MSDTNKNVNHPAYYGGEENVYEAIKVIEAWSLGFCLGNTIKYISRAGKKLKFDEAIDRKGHPDEETFQANKRLQANMQLESKLEDLRKARWYLDREISQLENSQ